MYLTTTGFLIWVTGTCFSDAAYCSGCIERRKYNYSTVVFFQRCPVSQIENSRSRQVLYKYMYRYVGHVISAIEKLVLDQVLNRECPSSRWGPPFGVVFARRASLCSSLPTLPGATSAVLASSTFEGCCFRFLVKISHYVLSIRTYRYISTYIYLICAM